MKNPDHQPRVRSQYEDYPYPERDPEDERKHLYRVYLDCLDRVNHYCHSGKKDFSAGSRILVVGGGTGDSTIFLAEQLRDTESEVVYLDFSEASMQVARKRADVRHLHNITWFRDSLHNLPSLNIGQFDHISCTGVLHHLESPVAGLLALASSLADSGSMTIMVYALYGRTAVYQIQEIMRLINRNESDLKQQVNNCRMALNSLPPMHWYHWSNPEDINVSDTELIDRFLHSQDRAYTVPQVYDFLEAAGLELLQFFDQREIVGNDLYDPGLYIKDQPLLESVRKFDIAQQQAIAELLNSRITQHSFYVARKCKPPPQPANLDLIPSLTLMARRNTYALLHKQVCAGDDSVTLDIPSTNARILFRKTPHMEAFFSLLDGKKSIREIYDLIILISWSTDKTLNHAALSNEFREMFAIMTVRNQLHLRHKSVPAYMTSEEMQARVHKYYSQVP